MRKLMSVAVLTAVLLIPLVASAATEIPKAPNVGREGNSTTH
jgi:hypothetical protein